MLPTPIWRVLRSSIRAATWRPIVRSVSPIPPRKSTSSSGVSTQVMAAKRLTGIMPSPWVRGTFGFTCAIT